MPGDPALADRDAPGSRCMTVPPWRTRSSRTIYQNPWMRLREDLVELPSGRTTIYGVVSTGACVGVLPFLDPDTVVLVRQYRYVAGRHTWEMPTGGVGPGEPIEAAAQRELAEESGYRAGRLEPVCVYHTSKSVMDETAHLFLAFDLADAEDRPEPDETESFQIRPHRFEEVLGMVDTGEIVDSMTIIAVLQAYRRRPVRGRRR
jgi:ADP-ribose pyrophosphatase